MAFIPALPLQKKTLGWLSMCLPGHRAPQPGAQASKNQQAACMAAPASPGPGVLALAAL